jgi:hypothetical protein
MSTSILSSMTISFCVFCAFFRPSKKLPATTRMFVVNQQNTRKKNNRFLSVQVSKSVKKTRAVSQQRVSVCIANQYFQSLQISSLLMASFTLLDNLNRILTVTTKTRTITDQILVCVPQRESDRYHPEVILNRRPYTQDTSWNTFS